MDRRRLRKFSDGFLNQERGRTCCDNRQAWLKLEGQKFASVPEDKLFGSKAAGIQSFDGTERV